MCCKFALRLFYALFYRQNAVVGVHREKSPDGLYSAYYPFGDLRDVQLMPRYHDKTTRGGEFRQAHQNDTYNPPASD